MKTYLYKVYTSAGVYIKTWNDVISDMEFPEEINSAGSEITLELARDITALGEDSDIMIDNQVKVYVVDDELPAGQLVYHGYILEYLPSYGADDNLGVTLSSFGLDLNENMLDMGDPVVQNQFYVNQDVGHNSFNTNIAQSLTPDHDVYVQSIRLWVKTVASSAGIVGRRLVVVSLIQGNPSGALPEASSLAGASLYVDSLDVWSEVDFVFDEPVLLSAATQYYFEIFSESTGSSPVTYLQASDRGSYADGNMFIALSGFTYGNSSVANYDLRFAINGGTTLVSNQVDISDMLRTGLDIYNSQGGAITYDGSSIDDTGIVKTFEFTGLTMLEFVKKCLELAPPGWYFYIDQATNLLHFHASTSTIDHTLVLGENIASIKPQKTKRNVVNTIYFIGDGIYKKYVRGTGATRAIRYVDRRVDDESVADQIANTILQARGGAEARVTVELFDNNGSGLGYDIESITVGENVVFRGIGNSSSSLWDIALWDDSYWDFKMSEMETFLLQIARIDRKPGSATLKLSSLPQDVNKRIEEITSKIVQDQTVDLASAPTV